MIALFVYGTLQHGPLLERLLGRAPDATPATLVGHRAAPLSGRAYPGLLDESGSLAEGLLILVTEAEASVLDRFEGAEYERRSVTVTVGSDELVPAEAWVLTGASRRLAGPGAWDLSRFLATDVDAFLDGSTSGDTHPGAGP